MDNQIHLLPFWLGFKRAVADYKRAFPQIWQVALPVIVLSAVASLLYALSGPDLNVVTAISVLARISVSILTALVLPGIFIVSIGNGQQFDLKTAYMAAIKKAPLFFVYSVFIVAVLLPTTLFFFVPGIYFSIMLGFFAYSYFLGAQYHSNPLVDSYMHVRGFFWQVLYRLIVSSVILFAVSVAAFMLFVVCVLVLGVMFRSVGVLPPVVIEIVGNVLSEAFMVLVPIPLYYLYGRVLFNDLKQARGYTYTEEEKKKASQVVLWAPIVSLVGAVLLFIAFAASISNVMQNAQSNLQKAREQAERERTVPTRGLNR